MINHEDVKKVIKERSELHPNDPSITDYWNKLVNSLNKNEKETIEFIKSCNDKELYYLSEIFEDLSIAFQSQNFVDELIKISKKHPKAQMDSDIDDAQRVIED